MNPLHVVSATDSRKEIVSDVNAGIQPAFLYPVTAGRAKNPSFLPVIQALKSPLVLHARNSGKAAIDGAFQGVNLP